MTRLILVMLVFAFICAGCGKEEPKPAQERVQSPVTIPPMPAAGKPTTASKAPEPAAMPEASTPAPEQNATGKQTPPGGYFDLMIDARHQAKDIVVLAPARQCVDAFKAMEGRLPKDLEELKAAGMEPPRPPNGKKWSYNPETGEITLVPATE